MKLFFTAASLLLAALLNGSPVDARGLTRDLPRTCGPAYLVEVTQTYGIVTMKNRVFRAPAHVEFDLFLERLCDSTKTVDFSIPEQKVILCKDDDGKKNEFFTKHAGDMFAEGHEILGIGNVDPHVSDEELDKNNCFVVTMNLIKEHH